MRRSAILLALLTIASSSWALPGNPATATPHDEVYMAVRRLALAARQSPPSAVSPMSYAELDAVMRRIDVNRLSPELREEYRRVLREVAPPTRPDAREHGGEWTPPGSVGVRSTIEGYLHTSDDPDEWLHWYPDRLPLLSIPIRVEPVPGLGIALDLDWRKNYPMFPGYEAYETVDPDPISNIPSDMRETDVQFPFTALLSAAGSGWSVAFGRSRIGWGLGHTGSLLLSDHVDYQDYLTASVFGRLASYRALYLDLEPWLNGGGTDPDRVYLAHRVELRPTDWLSLAANEAMIFSGKSIELRYLNPLMVLHSWFIPTYGNTMINVEVSARPVGGLELWAHMAVDQIQSAVEEERGYASSEPEALGYLAGAEYVTPIGGAWLSVGTEWAYLDPWMYIGRSVLGSFTYRRRVQAENVLPAGAKVIMEKSLGYPAGPDYYGVTGYVSIDADPRYRAALDMSFYAKGENDVGRSLPPDDADDAGRVTPSGTPEFVTAARVDASGTLATFDIRGVPLQVETGAHFDVIRVVNNDHTADALLWDVQFSPFISVSTLFSSRDGR